MEMTDILSEQLFAVALPERHPMLSKNPVYANRSYKGLLILGPLHPVPILRSSYELYGYNDVVNMITS